MIDTQTFVNEYQCSDLKRGSTLEDVQQLLFHNMEAQKCFADDDFVAVT
jgi:hypothetical protein